MGDAGSSQPNTPSAEPSAASKSSKSGQEHASVLVQRVRSIFDQHAARNADIPTEEQVLRTLKQLHKEYRRSSNEPGFKRAVTKAINEINDASTIGDRIAGTIEPSHLKNEVAHRKKARTNALSASLNSSYKSTTAKEDDNTQSQVENKANTSTQRPNARYSDLGGIESHLQELREICEYPLTHPEIYRWLGILPPRGVLLHGPPGCGKTLLAHAIAGELGVSFYKIAAPEIVSGMSGESEEKVRNLFSDAAANAPAIIFIDEIDAITSKRESNARGMELRIVAQLLTCMDGVGLAHDGVLVIGATNRPDALDPALRRAGRFDREICLGIPDEEGREKILSVLISRMRVSGNFDLRKIAKLTPGYVGADLNALTKEAGVVAVNRIFRNIESRPSEEVPTVEHGTETNLADRNMVSDTLKTTRTPFTQEQLEPLCVEMNDFLVALPKVQPSSKREGFATVPSVTWDDVGALKEAREELNLAITQPIKHPERFRDMGLTVPAGVLLFGPPGCGKSLLAKALANSSGANFISIKGPELLNKYVGESERAVRQVFGRARASAPCIIFFDELDALCPRRDSSNADGNGVSERVVNQLLTEMDGLDARKSVFVIAATNRPELIDPAMLRPGRLDRMVYVPLPNSDERISILKACVRKTPLDSTLDLSLIAKNPKTEGYSGADLAALVREAAVRALQRSGILDLPEGDATTAPRVTEEDFEYALTRVAPSVNDKDRKNYDRMNVQLSSVRERQIKGASS